MCFAHWNAGNTRQLLYQVSIKPQVATGRCLWFSHLRHLIPIQSINPSHNVPKNNTSFTALDSQQKCVFTHIAVFSSYALPVDVVDVIHVWGEFAKKGTPFSTSSTAARWTMAQTYVGPETFWPAAGTLSLITSKFPGMILTSYDKLTVTWVWYLSYTILYKSIQFSQMYTLSVVSGTSA